MLRQSPPSRLPAGRQIKVRPSWLDWRPAAAQDCRTRHCPSARSSTNTLPASQCPPPIWTASTLMTPMRRHKRLPAPCRLHLRAASVAGHRSIFNRTSVTCCTALALHSTSAVNTPSCLIAQPRSRFSSWVVRQRGCSPPSPPSRTTRDFLCRKISARRGRAVELRPLKHSAPRVPVCGQVFYEHIALAITISKIPRGQEEVGGLMSSQIHNYSTHPCIFPHHLRHTSVTRQMLLLLSSLYLILAFHWRILSLLFFTGVFLKSLQQGRSSVELP